MKDIDELLVSYLRDQLLMAGHSHFSWLVHEHLQSLYSAKLLSGEVFCNDEAESKGTEFIEANHRANKSNHKGKKRR